MVSNSLPISVLELLLSQQQQQQQYRCQQQLQCLAPPIPTTSSLPWSSLNLPSMPVASMFPLSFLHILPSPPSLVSIIHGQSYNHVTTTTNPLFVLAFVAADASASTFLGAPSNHSFPRYHPRQITPLLSLPSFPTPTNSDLYSVRSATRDQQPAQSSRRGKENTARVEQLLVDFSRGSG